MPKQADIRVQIPACTAAHFWDVVYERPEATERYHTSFNASTSTSVTPWLSGQRTVNFSMPLKLPDFLKRMVGLDSVAVTEVQRVVWHGGTAFTVSSETNITNMLGAGRFTTALQLTVTEQPQQHAASTAPASAASAGSSTACADPDGGVPSGCGGAIVQLVYTVRCAAASMPWPMSATIENVMSEKALVSMQSFLDFCTQLLEEHVITTAAAAEADAKTVEAVATVAASADGAFSPSVAAVHAATALNSAAARLSESGAVTAPDAATAAAAVPGGPWATAAPGPGPPIPLTTRASVRHRWPSITCSQDLGGIGGLPGPGGSVSVTGGEPLALLLRADTLGTAGGGDVFWDAPETFGAGGGSMSGVSSGGVSPRPLLLQSTASLRRVSADCASAAGAAASAVAVAAVAAETQQVAVAVDKLATAVAALDGKVQKLLTMQEQHRLQQLQDLQQQQQNSNPPAYLIDHPLGASRRDSGDGAAAAGRRSDVRWMFRVTLAVLLTTLLVMTYLLLHPYASGLRPHAGGGGGGGGTSPESVPLVSVLRINGGAAGALGRRGDGLGTGAGVHAGEVVGGGGVEVGGAHGLARLALAVPGHKATLHEGGGSGGTAATAAGGAGRGKAKQRGAAAAGGRRQLQRQRQANQRQ